MKGGIRMEWKHCWSFDPRPELYAPGYVANLLNGTEEFLFSPALRSNHCRLNHALPTNAHINGGWGYIDNLFVDPDTSTGFAELYSYLFPTAHWVSRSATLIEGAVHAVAGTILLCKEFQGHVVDCRLANLRSIEDWHVISEVRGVGKNANYHRPLFAILTRWFPDSRETTGIYHAVVLVIGHEQRERAGSDGEALILSREAFAERLRATRMVAHGHISIEMAPMETERRDVLENAMWLLLDQASVV
jgi:hypothetical protein